MWKSILYNLHTVLVSLYKYVLYLSVYLHSLFSLKSWVFFPCLFLFSALLFLKFWRVVYYSFHTCLFIWLAAAFVVLAWNSCTLICDPFLQSGLVVSAALVVGMQNNEYTDALVGETIGLFKSLDPTPCGA